MNGSAASFDGEIVFSATPAALTFDPPRIALPSPLLYGNGSALSWAVSALLSSGFPVATVVTMTATLVLTSVPGDPGNVSSYAPTSQERVVTTAFASLAPIKINAPPLLVDDAFTVVEDTPTVLDVVANDIDVDGNMDPTTITLVRLPAFGNATVVPRPTNTPGAPGPFVRYTGATNYYGPDSFSYKVCDLNAPSCDIAEVSLSVDAADDPIVAIPDFATVLEVEKNKFK